MSTRYRWSDLPKLLTLAILYALLANWVPGNLSIKGSTSVFWPPSGFAVAVLLLGGFRYWPAVFGGALASVVMDGYPLWRQLGVASGSTLEAVITVWLLLRSKDFSLELQRAQDYLWIFMAGTVGALASALTGTSILLMVGSIAAPTFLLTFVSWYQGNILSILLLTPLILVWRRIPWAWFLGARTIETSFFLGFVLLLGHVTFIGLRGEISTSTPLAYLTFLVVAWAAVRFGRHGALLVAFVTALQAPIGAVMGVGPFAADVARANLSSLWTYLLVLTVIGTTMALVLHQREQALEERKRVEGELRQSQERMYSFVRDAPVVLFVLDANGVFTFSEGRGLQTLGLRPGEAVGLSAFELYRAYPSIVDSLRRALGGQVHNAVHDLGAFVFDVYYTPLKDDKGRPAGAIGVATDITERKRAEVEREKLREQLSHAQRMESIGRLAGGVAHDFNNLLTVINGYAELALTRLPKSDKQRNELEEILKAGQRAAGLTEQLLAFSRKQILQPRALDLNRVVTDMRSMLKRLVGEDVEVRFLPCSEVPMVSADPHQLEQIIMNLAVNARDAMPRGGHLTIETSIVEGCENQDSVPELPPGRYVMLAVSDSGIGIDTATQKRIFEPFFTTKPPGKGTGMGLSMVHGIVAQSGGHISVRSELGQGATFRIHLPALGHMVTGVESPPIDAELHGDETILVVEDQADVRRYVAAVLLKYGYQVIEASSAPEALTVFDSHGVKIHLVLTDVVMPDMSGAELVARVAALRPEVKSLLMSGYTDEVMVQHGVIHEDASFIQKPFSPEELVAKVRAILG